MLLVDGSCEKGLFRDLTNHIFWCSKLNLNFEKTKKIREKSFVSERISSKDVPIIVSVKQRILVINSQ